MPEATSTSNEATQDGNKTSESTSAAGAEFTAITTQADLDKIIGERVARERGKYLDYEDLKTKAAEFDKLADANKSEIEKANERASAAEAEVAAMPAKVAEQLKTHLVALHEISAEDAELFLTATDPELLLKQVSRLIAGSEARQQAGNYAPNEGGSHTNSPGYGDGMRSFARDLFARANSE